jgi:hypothetical protein
MRVRDWHSPTGYRPGFVAMSRCFGGKHFHHDQRKRYSFFLLHFLLQRTGREQVVTRYQCSCSAHCEPLFLI